MTTLKPRPDLAQTLAALAWAAVALTPVGWFYGVLAFAYSHLGAARAGHRSGKIAVIVSGLLLLATPVITVVFALMNGQWIGQAVAMAVVVAMLVLAWVRSCSKPPPGPDDAQREEGPSGRRHARLSGRLRDAFSRGAEARPP